MVAELSDTSSRAHSLSVGATYAETWRTYRLPAPLYVTVLCAVYYRLASADRPHLP